MRISDWSSDVCSSDLDTTEAAARAEPGTPDPRQQVQDDVYGQLISTDRYTPAAAEAQAKLWAAAFARFGQMSGQDPLALYQRSIAGIGTGRPDGSDRKSAVEGTAVSVRVQP